MLSFVSISLWDASAWHYLSKWGNSAWEYVPLEAKMFSYICTNKYDPIFWHNNYALTKTTLECIDNKQIPIVICKGKDYKQVT